MSLGMIVFAGALVAGATGAFFSDSETSNANVFTAGSIDLSIGSHYSSQYNGSGQLDLLTDNNGRTLFTFNDLKPGDEGTVAFDLQVSSNDAYVCAMTESMSSNDNGIVDPEADAGDVTDGAGNGELQNYLQFATFADLDNDGVYDQGTEPVNVNQYGGDSNGFTNAEIAGANWVPVADPTTPNTWLTTGSMTANTPYSAGMLYCFGNFTTTGSLDTTQVTGCDGGTMGQYNDAQTDSASGSITFSAVQTRNNGGFTCDSLNDQ
jgi:predicted ribosomally synthesized peptide with SipW-like signal peptide